MPLLLDGVVYSRLHVGNRVAEGLEFCTEDFLSSVFLKEQSAFGFLDFHRNMLFVKHFDFMSIGDQGCDHIGQFSNDRVPNVCRHVFPPR